MILVNNTTTTISHRFNSSLSFEGLDISLRVIQESTNDEINLTLTPSQYTITEDGFLEIDAVALGIISAMKQDKFYNYIMLVDSDRIYYSKMIKLSNPNGYSTTYSMPLNYIKTDAGFDSTWKTLENG